MRDKTQTEVFLALKDLFLRGYLLMTFNKN